jgi:hypothetical protein
MAKKPKKVTSKDAAAGVPSPAQAAAPKALQVVPIEPPPPRLRATRAAAFPADGERGTRYTLPRELETGSPVGYRTRVPLSRAEAEVCLPLLSMGRPTAFAPGPPVSEQAFFEEASLGVLSARQSTNFRGHLQTSFGPEDSARIAHLLRGLQGLEAEPLDDAAYTHIVLSRPYRTPFTLLLTFVGHHKLTSGIGVVQRALDKRLKHADDIPTIGYLQHLHVGILADAMERAAVVASDGARRAQVFMAPFSGRWRDVNKPLCHALEEMAGRTLKQRSEGWQVALVAQVGYATEGERINLPRPIARKLGANLLAFRSERILPGENQEDKAPPQYHEPQGMDVPEELTVQAGRAAYNAFGHWTGTPRDASKSLLLLERIDALTPAGRARVDDIRKQLHDVTDKVVEHMPAWADLPMGRSLTRNAERGRKAFALVGQRVYITGLSRPEIGGSGLDWVHAVRAVGAAASRSALYAELMGVVDLPEDADLLAGVCLMAGPVNQNDIGKQFHGHEDLLTPGHAGRDPTSLLVWTLKAKTVADPIGNEEQLLNPARKGALVDLRPAPHEVVRVARGRKLHGLRQVPGRSNQERAFGDVGNFVVSPQGHAIPGNRGMPWPKPLASAPVWNEERS